MSFHKDHHGDHVRPHCCPCSRPSEEDQSGLSRRAFLGGAALGGLALSGLTWSTLQAAEPGLPQSPGRKPLTVKPIFMYSTYKPVFQRSWRSWGGIQTEEDAKQEVARINGEVAALEKTADFPVKFLPLAAVRNAAEVTALGDLGPADALLVYAANGGSAINAVRQLNDAGKGKDVIFFVRHKSGPVYLWYEIISPRFLRQHTDERKVEGMDFDDVVVDSQDDILWRLRALCGLKNAIGSRIIAVGGPGGWAQNADTIRKLVEEKWKLDIQTLTYPELGGLIKQARQDKAEVALAKRRADEYLKLPGTTLETKREFVDNAFLLEQVFRKVMAKADCRMITINGCMGTIMPIAETSACLALSTLNDDGYLAFCESDFVVIPSGMLLCSISGRPPFFNDPTYPHHGVVTLAHCTGPRKMDGKNVEPARILTHFESDYGAAPKVEMAKGQVVTNVVPDFKEERWMGLKAEIVDHPFLPICRDQIDVKFAVDPDVVNQRMPGFHWMTVYGDYTREVGYALKKIPIQWDFLG